MRNRWLWIFLAIIVLGVLAEYSGLSSGIATRITSLANQPSVAGSFQDPESGRTDALTTLIAFAILTPMGIGMLLVALVLLAKGFEAVVVSCRLPGWLSAPVVGMGTVVTIYVTSAAWLPSSLYALGIVARAYLVYTHGSVPVIR
jgi:hypothetical protein